MTKNSDLFWLYNEVMCPSLSAFAIRLLNTIANSVPSERVWLSMNYIHSKTQNKLLLDKVNKLLFIYINSRVLEHLRIDPLETNKLAWGE